MNKENNLSETDLAYLAGIIDGEGCICVTKQNKKWKDSHYHAYILKLIISNTDIRLINWLLEKGGSEIVVVSGTGNKFTKHKVYQIYWQNEAAKDILKKVIKYMVIKKDRAEFVVKEYPGRFVSDKQKREFCYNRVRELNRNIGFVDNKAPILIPSKEESEILNVS